MKFIINREDLLNPLQHIVGVIEKRQTMPVLANVLLVVSDQTLVLTGTDLEIQLVGSLTVRGSVAGGITVPARKLLDLCRLLPANEDIQFETDGDKAKILSDRGRFSLSCLPSEHYPEFPETDLDKQFGISSAKLKKALEKTIFCMANQDVRYYLNGLLMQISNNKLKFVASDGHRLAIFEDELGQATGYEHRVILPRKGVMELHRLLDDTDKELVIKFSNNNIKVDLTNLVFTAKLVDAKYPDFSKVYQQPFLQPITIPKQELKDALTRVAILSNEKFKGVTLDFDDNNMRMSAHNPEHDEAEEDLPIPYIGEKLSIAFNSQYLLDAINNIVADTVSLMVASNISTCFIDEPTPAEYRFIVMPMRL